MPEFGGFTEYSWLRKIHPHNALSNEKREMVFQWAFIQRLAQSVMSSRAVTLPFVSACICIPQSAHVLPRCFIWTNKLYGRTPQYSPAPCNGSAQRQPWARPAELGPMSQYAPSQPAGWMYATDVVRQTSDVRRALSLNAPPRGRGHNKWWGSRHMIAAAVCSTTCFRINYSCLRCVAYACVCVQFAIIPKLRAISSVGVWRRRQRQLGS